LLTRDFAAHEDAPQSVALQPSDSKLLVSGTAVVDDFNRINTRIMRLEGGGPCTSVPYDGEGDQAGLRMRIRFPHDGDRVEPRGRLILRGIAHATGRQIETVQIALQRVSRNRCFLLRSHDATFTDLRKRGRCPKRWLDARGTSDWSDWFFGITDALPRGAYRLHARVVLTDGTVRSANAVRFSVF